MIHSTLQVFKKSSLSALALGGIVFVGSLLPQEAKAFIPAYTTSTPARSNPTDPGVNSSFGFFFDTARNVSIDALGFAGDTAWANGTSYTVKLWSFINGGGDPSYYTPITEATFTQGGPYTLQFNYYWKSIDGGPISLPDTSSTVDPLAEKGYVISAIGDFSGVDGYISPQFVSPNTNPPGSVTFNSRIDIADYLEINGFSDENDTLFFDIPIDPTPLDPTETPRLGNNGYFNANLSFVSDPPPAEVPGPLPLFGAFVGFSFSRRLRKRIQATR